jgi:transcriptional regulator with XRE-family HTH domain
MKALLRYLKKTKIRPAEFARRCGVQRSTVSQWMSGQRRPDRGNSIRIEEVTRGLVPAKSWNEVAPSRP